MNTNIDKKWSIHELKDVNLKGDLDVTNSKRTFFYVITIAFIIYTFTPYNIDHPLINYIQFILFKILKFISIFTEINTLENFINNSIQFINIHAQTISVLKILLASYLFYKLIFNKNFILYDILYRFVLHTKLVTIDDNFSSFTSVLSELERIILGSNKNCGNCKKNINLKDKITFFWIRKDKKKSRERSIKQLIPFLSLIVILFALKNKRYKLVAVIGLYLALVGLLFIIFLSYVIESYSLVDNATIVIASTISLIIWYLLTIYGAYNLVDIDKYLKLINITARRAHQKSNFNFGKAYNDIIKTFDRDNVIYIYDYRLDEYQIVNKEFLLNNLKRSKLYIEKSIGTMITLILSIILVVFVEILANGIFQKPEKDTPFKVNKIITVEQKK